MRSMSPKLAVATLLLGLCGCTTLQEFAALRLVDFKLDRVSDVRIAGIALGSRTSYSQLTALEIGRLALAAQGNDVPLEMVIHVSAENPPDNRVSARLTDLDWTLFIEDRQIVDGRLAGTYLLPPGEPVDVPLGVKLDLLDFFTGGARDLFALALALAGQGGASKEIRLEAKPTIQTSLGPIQYPGTITIRREVGTTAPPERDATTR